MKKIALPLIASMVMADASAQSSVTIFGVVDAAVSRFETSSRFVNSNPFFSPSTGTATTNRHQSQTALTNSGYNNSRIGFRGTEDLGGGYAAGFWLESPVANDDGSTGLSTFSRRSTLSLSGPFGEVRLGRDYTTALWNDTVFDPFATSGSGASLIFNFNASAIYGLTNSSSNPNTVRTSNSIGYFLPPNLNGFYGQAQYAFPEAIRYSPADSIPNTPNSVRTGRYVGARVGYLNGPLDVAFGGGKSTIGDQFYSGVISNVIIANFGASYDFGVFKAMAEISQTQNKASYVNEPVAGVPSNFTARAFLLGVTVPIGPSLVRATYSSVQSKFESPKIFQPQFSNRADPGATKLALGYIYNLSRRTALYATVARTTNKNGLAITGFGNAGFTNSYVNGTWGATGYQAHRATGYDMGIRHTF